MFRRHRARPPRCAPAARRPPMGAITESIGIGGCAASGAWAVAALFAARAARAAEGGRDSWCGSTRAGSSIRRRPFRWDWIRGRCSWCGRGMPTMRCGPSTRRSAAATWRRRWRLPRLTMPILRRLQLAAAAGAELGLLVRPGREGRPVGGGRAAEGGAGNLRRVAPPSLAQGEPAAGGDPRIRDWSRARGGWNQGRVLAEVGCDGAAYSLPRLSPSIE